MITLEGHEIKPTIFPDKTSQVWKLPQILLFDIQEWNKASIVWKFESEAECIHLAQLVTLLDSLHVKTITLHLPYLPYARQDKDISNDATFGLHTFAYLLNSLDFSEITCLDPHSDVAMKLIRSFKPIYPTKEVERAMLLTDATLVCYPDAGAAKKYPDIYKLPYIFGEKVRDQATGNILTYKLCMDAKDARAAVESHSYKSKYDAKGKNILVVDDLCDGGATFIILAKKLFEVGAKSVSLFVSHGIFSKGKQVLYDAGIKYVLTPEDLDE